MAGRIIQEGNDGCRYEKLRDQHVILASGVRADTVGDIIVLITFNQNR